MEALKLDLDIDNLTRARNQVLGVHQFVKELGALAQPPVVQEVTLALRELENARMRLGVARALLAGEDPYPIEHINLPEEEE